MKAIVTSLLDQSKRTTTVALHSSHPLPNYSDNLLRIRVLASPIEVSDVLNVNGDFPATTFPRVPGRNFAGVVTDPADHPLYQKLVYGTSGSQFSFTVDGAHAEYISTTPEGVAEVPAGVDLKSASIMGTPWTTAYLSLLKANAQEGETVLVLGAGGAVGDAAVQLAKSILFRCNVLTAGRGEKYDVDSTKFPDSETLKVLTGGKGGVDVVVDTTGDVKLINDALSSMVLGGRMTGTII
jgi:NADPH2:quinone reductase